ncbi:hypothetical protein BDZ85DRAFT_258972 [Elsinoe ampelina]|uniref:Uncharacterized protein n=1 Tax=Elsinoe ampelina TaxID=302913 RepID=A0A6A6GG70_9PEZI|nr:hypothetical protein BDZ85DRAFT_258972 [Elsinoe ampelina]
MIDLVSTRLGLRNEIELSPEMSRIARDVVVALLFNFLGKTSTCFLIFPAQITNLYNDCFWGKEGKYMDIV